MWLLVTVLVLLLIGELVELPALPDDPFEASGHFTGTLEQFTLASPTDIAPVGPWCVPSRSDR